MARLFPWSVPRLILVAFLAVLACAGSASANNYLTWNFSGVTLEGGGNLTGYFTIDITTTNTQYLTVGSWAITATASPAATLPGTVDPFEFTAVNSRAVVLGGGPITHPSFYPLDSFPTIYPSYTLVTGFVGTYEDLKSPGAFDLIENYSSYYVYVNGNSGAYYPIKGGKLVSAVPIPSALLLLGAGLFRLAAYRRRKMKG